ncbi:MAG: ATP-binding protein, partial [Ferruginibacter sp.]
INNSVKINQYRADEKGVLLKTDIDKTIYPFLSGDPVRLNQILVNLVGNAIKFTDHGEVNVKAMLLKENDQSVELEFSVTDTGIGIAEDKVESVFERFTQVSGTSTRKYGGTGLGLTITRQLIELQGGTIHVKSHENKGSVFTFYLTIRKGRQPVNCENKLTSKEQANTLNGVNILLVEDNIINQKVAMKSLSGRGALMDVANHGKEAIELLNRKKYDIILMDLQMPEMDGYEATRIIRTEMSKEISLTPIIAMTASALITDRDKCLQAGMNDYIAKPFLAHELNEKILLQLEK